MSIDWLDVFVLGATLLVALAYLGWSGRKRPAPLPAIDLTGLQPPVPPPQPLPPTSEELARLRDQRCIHCGGAHAIACPRVKRLRFRADGQTPLEVEFWADRDWPKDRVVFLEDWTTTTEPPEEPA